MLVRRILLLAICALLGFGCSSKPKAAQLSGKVTFKGQPVPAGYISFTPDVANGGKGQVRVLQIKEGRYDSSQETPPGIEPQAYFVEIAGFDGKILPNFGQGKQIFNKVKDIEVTIADSASTKDFVVPDSAGENVRIQPTADP